MEQAEAGGKGCRPPFAGDRRNKKIGEGQIAQLGQREENLKKELAELQRGRAELAAAVDPTVVPAL